MTQQALVSYFYQSAFTVSMQKTLLVFSYRETNIPQVAENQRLTDKDFLGFNNILVFVPSASADHLDTSIFDWKQSFPITYIMPEKAAGTHIRTSNVRVVREGDEFTVGHSDIKVFGSSDDGVSFLVKAEGITVYHAGDLNLWHWREENTLRDIAKAEALFYEKVSHLPKDQIDIAFFPLDPNQGGLYDAGANHFIMQARPRVFFPMHFASRTEIANEYARRSITRRTVIFALTGVRDSALIDFTVSPVLIRSNMPQKPSKILNRGSVDLNAYVHEDPFSQTDLPVSINKTEAE